MKYPRKFICVLSASYPDRQLSYNDQAQHIAQGSQIKPLDRITAHGLTLYPKFNQKSK
jgi:hypothetical protein